jgi:hypothetical protein
MRVILHKELKQVLERRGLKDRAWAVEWEASALEFLLDKGFSPEMGARPLKRAIDQFVVAPLAATIVEHRFPEGEQFVFFRSDGHGIHADFVDPDAPPATPVPAEPDEPGASSPTLASMVLGARATVAEIELLAVELQHVDRALTSAEWDELKRSLSAEMSLEGFWSKADRYRVLARLALMDRVAAPGIIRASSFAASPCSFGFCVRGYMTFSKPLRWTPRSRCGPRLKCPRPARRRCTPGAARSGKCIGAGPMRVTCRSRKSPLPEAPISHPF